MRRRRRVEEPPIDAAARLDAYLATRKPVPAVAPRAEERSHVMRLPDGRLEVPRVDGTAVIGPDDPAYPAWDEYARRFEH
jgi:hypothetical protein